MDEHALTRPSAQYAAGAAAGAWLADPAQHDALAELDRIHDALLASAENETSFMQRMLMRIRPKGVHSLPKGALRRWPAPVRGLYLWGGVGRGKTFLTELLFEALPIVRKRRLHFHRFMADIHARLRALPQQRDPLRIVARDLAAEARLLVLDECVVTDIGDAMLLGHLLELLFASGVTLVATSNIVPRDLYKDGLQRAQFLPAIAAIERNCAVRQLDGAHDYRLRHLQQASTWTVPADATSEAKLGANFAQLAMGLPRLPETLRINDRTIIAEAHADGIVWFDFGVLCDGPRAVADYIEIAREYHTVLVSNVPAFNAENEDAAKRFVLLVDEFYDRHVNLLASAAAAPIALYRGRRHAADFARTESRLIEMQSDDYLALEHRP